ncbi:VIT1/CCC1 transporter family protein [Pseudonocardia alni]|uniref:VIT1/CCC1 transporter family protein n=1 Tax=Pseudonocardia TaxID=1847 RepID=UPI001371CCA7|nr:hypothetical protein [Pseudonocardia sp. SID8383]
MNDPELEAELADHSHDHSHRDVSGGWLRAATFGAMDGLVTTIALIAGVGGGGAGRDVIVLSGLAGVVAGAFSMALGEFASVGTQNDALDAEAAVERRELAQHPRAEQHELAARFREMGLSEQTADAVSREVHRDPELALRMHISQELGVSLDDKPSPWVAAVSSFAAFAVGGLIPLITFLLGYGSLALGLAVGGVGLLVAGALTSRFTSRSWWSAALRQLAFGAIAAGATYLVGMLIGVSAA